MEKRLIKRKIFYKSDNVKAILITSIGSSITGHLHNISPAGLGVIVDDNKFFKVGEMIRIQIGEKSNEFSLNAITLSCKSINISEMKNCYCVGLIPVENETSNIVVKNDRRKGMRLQFSPFIQPTLTFEHPFIYSEIYFVKIYEMSSGGITGLTSLRNSFLIKGMKFNSTIILPMVGSINISCEVTNIKVQENDLKIGVKFVDDSLKKNISKITDFITLVNPQLNFKDLEKSGFKINGPNDFFSYQYLTTKKDLEDIYHLRHRAYLQSVDFVKEMTPLQMLDSYDGQSRHVVCKFHGKIIGAIRITFNDKNIDKSQIKSQFNVTIPEHIINEGFCEIGKLCVEPNFQSTNISTRLIEISFKIANETNNKYVVITAEPRLVDFYKNIGFSELKGSFRYDEYKVTLQTLIANVQDFLNGQKMRSSIHKKFSKIIDYNKKK